MSVTCYAQPKLYKWDKAINLATDTLKVGLIASGTAIAARATSEGFEYVSDLLANNGTALTEVSTSGTGYTRQSLTSVTLATSGLVTSLSAANPQWTSSTISSTYAFFYDETASSATDATRPLLAIWDFGGTNASSSGNFTLTLSGGVLITFTSAV